MSYSLILIVASQLDCQRLRLSLYFQVLALLISFLSLTMITAHAFFIKNISASVLDSIRNLMTTYKKNLLYKLDIANLFQLNLSSYEHGFSY